MTVVITPEGKSHPLAGQSRETTYTSRRQLDSTILGFGEQYAKLYSEQPWIFAVVNKLSRGVARLPLKSYLREGDETEELGPRDAPAHPLPVLLTTPHPKGSQLSLLEATVGNLAIYGHAAWWKFRPSAGRAPVELWPLPWQHMSFKTSKDGTVQLYEYNGPAGRKAFLADDIVHFAWWSPHGLQGTSPLEPLRVTLALEDAGRRYAVSSFAHGARPSGAVTTPKSLDPDSREELRQELQLVNSGPDNAFRIALMDGGMDWKPFAHTAQEAETIAHRKLNREEVCAVYDIPPPVVHILDRATFSNIREQNLALYREALGPWLEMIAQTVEAQLLWGENEYANTYVEFNLDAVLQADIEKRAAAYKSLEQTLTLNERRRLENKPPIGDPADDANPANGVLLPLNGALVLRNGTVLQLGAGGEPVDEPAEPVDEEALIEEALSRFRHEQERLRA